MNKRHDKNTTMQDIAILAGVSQMTVSRVFSHNRHRVAQKTIDKVLAIADELGYVHNTLASALVSGNRTNVLAVIIPTMDNRVFNDVLNGITVCATKYGLSTMCGITGYDMATEEKLVSDFLALHPWGLIITGVDHTERTNRMITQNNFPTVEIMDIDSDSIHSSFGISQIVAGKMMATHLVKQGYRKIAYVGRQKENDFRINRRQQSFIKTLGAYNITCREWIKPNVQENALIGRVMTQQLLEAYPDTDAIFYEHDILAMGGMFHCISENISIPDQVALAGFSNLSYAQALPYPLTTIDTPRYEMGYDAAYHLIKNPDKIVMKDMGLTFIQGVTT